MRRFVAVACLVFAGCEKADSGRDGSTASAAKTLEAAPLPSAASYEAWCATLGKGICRGDWEGRGPGTSALGPYRFVQVEYTEHRDGDGPARDIYLELRTARGVGYFNLGRTRAGPVVTSVLVKEVVDRAGALEVRAVFRNSQEFTYSDYHGANFILEGANGLSVVQVALGKIVGDENTGKTTGQVGEAQWQGGKLILKGASVADGEWGITRP